MGFGESKVCYVFLFEELSQDEEWPDGEVLFLGEGAGVYRRAKPFAGGSVCVGSKCWISLQGFCYDSSTVIHHNQVSPWSGKFHSYQQWKLVPKAHQFENRGKELRRVEAPLEGNTPSYSSVKLPLSSAPPPPSKHMGNPVGGFLGFF